MSNSKMRIMGILMRNVNHYLQLIANKLHA
jgi:hypothetical protein